MERKGGDIDKQKLEMIDPSRLVDDDGGGKRTGWDVMFIFGCREELREA